MKVQWGVLGGLPECPYFRKWVIDFGPFAIRLHRWYADDDHRAPHDHPYWFWTFVLRGGYVDIAYDVDENGGCTVSDAQIMGRSRRERIAPGLGLGRGRRWAYRPAEHLHSVQRVLPNTWTLLISGRPFRRWGFQIGGKKLMRDKYFAVHGHHPCDPTGDPVRIKPNGTRIGA